MEFHPEKVFFKTDTVDPYTSLPVYAFDSTYLPSSEDIASSANSETISKSFEEILLKTFKKVIPRIPTNPYVLVCFTSGFKNLNTSLGSQSWITLLKCYQLLPGALKQHLKKAYIVHESWIIRSFIQVLSKINIKPFKTSQGETKYDRLIYVKDLTELSKFVDITKIRISLNVYLFDNVERLIVPYQAKHTSHEYIQYSNLINQRVLQRLSMEGPQNELVLSKPGNPARLNILIKAIERGNYLDLSQWDIYIIGSFLHHTLRSRHCPLIPISQVTLPMDDSFEYTLQTFQSLDDTHDPKLKDIMPILVGLLESADVTKHNLKMLSRAMTPSFCHVKTSLQHSDEFIIGQRFIKNLLEYWNDIEDAMSSGVQIGPRSMSPVQKKTPPIAPKSRKVSQPMATSMPSTANLSSSSPTNPERRQTPKTLPNIPISLSHKSSTSSLISTQSDRSRSRSPQRSSPSTANTTSTSISIMTTPTATTATTSDQEILDPATLPTSLKPQPNKPAALSKNPPKPKPLKADLKFSDESYGTMKGGKKVSQLARLYEERLRGLEVMKELRLDD
ncbi:hypothetical protein WICPIJ_005601 [Wickerhamomyces pijperi]|uniref:Rho-GAP domain-containing protein n=1 Tax=Wickerhamomyces pijperi TaxID=599730 RepID=A0A9P8Q5Z7_WICPI|nr:hypothetical protein WICPIJ_005601 [Wickerhamomyces pijperi]